MKQKDAFDFMREDLKPLLNKRVKFTKFEGSKKVEYKGVLTGIHQRLGVITLDKDEHNYDTYAFNYYHLLLNEGKIEKWIKPSTEPAKDGVN